MAECTPKLLASYEAAHATRAVTPPSDDYGPAAQVRIIALLDRSIKRVHVDMDDFSHNLLATILFGSPEQWECVQADR